MVGLFYIEVHHCRSWVEPIGLSGHIPNRCSNYRTKEAPASVGALRGHGQDFEGALTWKTLAAMGLRRTTIS